MTLPVAAQITVAAVWMGLYLGLSLRYHRRWDARIRAALGRRPGTQVGRAAPDPTHGPPMIGVRGRKAPPSARFRPETAIIDHPARQRAGGRRVRTLAAVVATA
ncbi:hypothetical protein Cs7R123_50910 [Catellatospora sp. TT07R-123]|uniref:hypothetical protein n=1 Tax=Catellatospora sp. TT07R-123 TaxID=2733863 RepID=UPI001B12BEBD|nr:hypothetical protein [Catellatospora sp. TT07R-123]GHJ47749.1 hypothetical protein Cs7R123_50910 [Catellatospora sp. TT07R-123]